MKSLLCATGVLAITAGTASAASFQFLSFQAGAGLEGVQGVGFSASSGDFFKSPNNAGVTAGPFAFFGLATELEWDTYFGIDNVGPSAKANSVSDVFYGFGGDHETNNTGTVPGLTLAPGSNIAGGLAQVGIGISPQPFFSGLAPDGRDGVFIMRGTVDPGESIVGGMRVGLQEGPGDVNLDGTTAMIGGQTYGLVATFIAGPGENGGVGDTYDVWFEVIPTPGALTLFGLGGIAALRRRR